MKLSIVTTLYKSQPFVEEFYRRISSEAKSLFSDDYEILFVNDGSPDFSLDLAMTLAEQDSKVTVLNLSRNFGHHNAILAGLENCKGQLVFLIDIDLEEKPEWLRDFYNELINKRADVIFGSQISRKGKFVEKFFGWIFWTLFFRLAKISPQQSPVVARLMTRNYLNGLLLYSEKNFFLGGISAHAGYLQLSYPVEKGGKKSTTYSFFKRLKLALDALTAFTAAPLMFLSLIGLGMAIIGGGMFFDIIFQKITGKILVTGWSSIMASLWFLFGVLTSSVSIVGLYIAKIYDEVKGRPRYIVKSKFNNSISCEI